MKKRTAGFPLALCVTLVAASIIISSVSSDLAGQQVTDTPDAGATTDVESQESPGNANSETPADSSPEPAQTPPANPDGTANPDSAAELDRINEKANELISDTTERVTDLAQEVDKTERAKEVSAGILQPIYVVAEKLSFPSFHWLAFAAMTAGVVSFTLQLVLAKLAVLAKFSFSLMEFLSDGLGLLISVVGLVLTTQAAAQNSTFTTSPSAVISATALGCLVGFIFYWNGQAQELQAVDGRRQGQVQDRQPPRRRR